MIVRLFIEMSFGWMPTPLRLVCVFVTTIFFVSSLVGAFKMVIRLIPGIGKLFGRIYTFKKGDLLCRFCSISSLSCPAAGISL